MGGSCSTHGRYEKCIKYRLENLKGRDQSEDLGVYERINIIMDLREMWWDYDSG
jgi:hypothetical protein